MVQMTVRSKNGKPVQQFRINAPTMATMKKLASYNAWSGSIINRQGEVTKV